MEEATLNKNTMADITLAIQSKQKFSINGDPDKYIELNTGDIGITARYASTIPKLNEWVETVEKLDVDLGSEESLAKYANDFQQADNSIREYIDYIFDYGVSEVCGSGGSMFDVYNGKFRFEVILETLFGMYDKTISAEVNKLQKRMRSHTDKYIAQDHRKKS